METSSGFKSDIEKLILAVKTDIERVFTSRFSTIEKKLLEIEKSRQFQAAQYESFRAQVGNVLRIHSELKTENETLLRKIKDMEKKDEQRAKSVVN